MINSTKKRVNNSAHLNHMNGTSYNIGNPIVQLRTMAASCFFGEPMFYSPESKVLPVNRDHTNRSVNHHNEYLDQLLEPLLTYPDFHNHSPSKLMEIAIDEALAFDPEATLQEAVRLRNDENIRTTPQVIMVRAANHDKVRGTGLIRKYGQEILSRTDEAAVQLAYQIQVFGKPIPNALKRAWKTFLESKNEFQLAKYKMEKRAFKTLDVVNLVHAKSDPIQLLMTNNLKLKTSDTWEALISKEGSSTETWTKAIDLMGHMALLRNLRNFIDNNVDSNLFLPKLIETASKGKQLPFRYFNAYEQLKNVGTSGKVLDAIEECMELSIGELPTFNGKVMSLCDNSGSSRGQSVSKMSNLKTNYIANLMAVLTGKVSDDGYIGVFGDRLETMPIRKKESILSQTEKANSLGETVGMGTENGVWLFLDDAIKNKKHYDHLFIYSDMQAGHGGLYGLNANDYIDYIYPNSGRYIDVAALVKEYRKEVNPDIMVYMVQVAGYKDTLIPEYYNKTFVLGGWSDNILRFAHEMQKQTNEQ